MRRQVSYGSLFTVLLLAAVILMSGCSTLPPAKPIKDIKNIAGTWKSEDGERTLFLNADGKYRSQGGRGTSGTYFIEGGKMVNVRGSTFTLHEVEGKQVLFSISGRGNRRVWRRVK